MSAQGVLNQYWRLILVMVLPVRYVKWLGLLTLVVLIPGVILNFFGHSLVLYLGSAFSLLLLMMVGMLVPGQMLALRSSKHFKCMADLRYKLFFIALGFWLLTSLVLTFTLGFFDPKHFSFWSGFSLITMVLSFTAVLLVVVGSYVQTGIGFVPLFVWVLFFSAKNTDLFSSAYAPVYWLTTAALWLGMYIWWFRWQPQKYLSNFMTLPAAELQRQQSNNLQSIADFFSAAPKTLAGSLLVGASDGVPAQWKWELGQLVFFLATLAVMLFWTKDLPPGIAGFMCSVYLFIFLCIRGGVLFQAVFRNLYRLWVNSPYSRSDMLTYIERRYYLLLVSAIMPPAVMFGLINHYVLDDLVSMFMGSYLLMIGLLICCLSFYLGLFIYIKSAASFLWLNWVTAIFNIGLLVPMVYFNILFGSSPSGSHVNYLIFSAVLLVLILVGRSAVKALWQTVNLFRVIN